MPGNQLPVAAAPCDEHCRIWKSVGEMPPKRSHGRKPVPLPLKRQHASGLARGAEHKRMRSFAFRMITPCAIRLARVTADSCAALILDNESAVALPKPHNFL